MKFARHWKFSDMGFNEPSDDRGNGPEKFGRFTLHELINSGGMAEIWVATDEDGKTYALRRLHKTLRFNFVARKRFVRGCEILSKIHNHEFVIGYFEHGKISGTPYLLMEYVEGSNLKLLLARSDEVLTESVGNILIDSAVALEHVHDSGFMHMDFKPENVLVTPNGNVRLVDFDLALPRPEKPKTFSGNPGTPAYMSPEQLQRQPIDHRADIFAYGVTAYEVLTFEKPFAGNSAQEILQKQLSGEMMTPRELNPDIPEGMESIILKCLERDAEKRYPHISVLVHDLKTVLYVD